MLILSIALLLVCSAVALAVRAAVATQLRSRELIADLGAYGFGAAQAGHGGDRHSLRESIDDVTLHIGRRLERRLTQRRVREMRVLLNSAGYYRTTVARYLGYRVVAALGVPLALLALGPIVGIGGGAVLAAVAVGGLGWGVPAALIRRRARVRLERIDHEVPELVDLLVTTVEAGIGFGAALQMSARRVRGPLGDELRLTLREQSMGLPLDGALENLLERTKQSGSMRVFVQAIVQGEMLGVSVGKILRDLAVEMRKRRRQLAEEQAQKAPVKILFPLAVLLLPAVFVVLLYPGLHTILETLGGG
jgi:tight adherence protein C